MEVEEEHEAVDHGIAAGDEIRDPETFDDGEFYQTLLKEFFEGKQEGGANWYSVSMLLLFELARIHRPSDLSEAQWFLFLPVSSIFYAYNVLHTLI